jgi:hypothetical protein
MRRQCDENDIVIQDEADHAEAKKLIEKLMGSSEPGDRARMVAQARLVEAYERSECATHGADSSSSCRVPNGPAWPFARRSRALAWHSQPRERGLERKAGLEHDDGAPAPGALSHLSRFARYAGSNSQQNSGISLTASIDKSYTTPRGTITL